MRGLHPRLGHAQGRNGPERVREAERQQGEQRPHGKRLGVPHCSRHRRHVCRGRDRWLHHHHQGQGGRVGNPPFVHTPDNTDALIAILMASRHLKNTELKTLCCWNCLFVPRLWPKPESVEHQQSHLSHENEGSQQGRPHGGSHRTLNPPGSQLGAASEVSERSGISPNPTAMSQYEMAQQSARQLDSIMHKRTTSLAQGSYGKGSHNPAMSRIANNLLGQRQSSSSRCRHRWLLSPRAPGRYSQQCLDMLTLSLLTVHREIPRGINPHEPKKRGAKKNRSRTAIGEDTSPADRQKGVRKVCNTVFTFAIPTARQCHL